MTEARNHGWLWRVAGILLVTVVLALMVRQLLASWPAVKAYPWQLNPALLVLSFAFTQAGYLTLSRAWRTVLRAIRVRLALTTAYWLFILSNLGRYLPGKFWQIGAAAVMGRKIGLSPRDVAPSLVVYQLYLLPAGALIALSGGHLPAPFDSREYQVLSWAAAGLCALAAIWPHIVLRLMGPVARTLGIEWERWRLEVLRRVAIAFQCLLGWILLAIGFGCFVMAVMPLSTEHLLTLSRVFVASYLLGYLALVAPGGLGVREGVMAVLLQPLIGWGPATALALLSRAWVTVSELIAILPALVWARRDRAQASDPDAT